jgi:NADH-quinone oxidoreductase subunit A
MQLNEYTGFFVFFGLMVFVGILFIVLSHLAQIRIKGEKNEWARPYECGLKTEGFKPDRYPIHYYLVGILFVLFDVETVFIVPWAVVSREFRQANLQMFWFVEMVVFLAILVIGYVYLLQRGVLNWGSKTNE